LIVTDVVSDGFTMTATVIVWAASLIAAWILALLRFKKYMEERR
jgi:ABC-type Co2+ transport system permease subunit